MIHIGSRERGPGGSEKGRNSLQAGIYIVVTSQQTIVEPYYEAEKSISKL